MSDEKRIEVTTKNALILSTGLLDTIVQQNRVIIERLGAMNGLLSKLANLDIEEDNGNDNDSK
jgi:hypothetical protein